MAMLHLLAERRLQRFRRSRNMSTEWPRRGAGSFGCSGLTQCSKCNSRDPIGKAVRPPPMLLIFMNYMHGNPHEHGNLLAAAAMKPSLACVAKKTSLADGDTT